MPPIRTIRSADPTLLQDKRHQLLGQDVKGLRRGLHGLDEALPARGRAGRRLAAGPRRSSPGTGSSTVSPPAARCGPSAGGTRKPLPGRRSGSPGRGRPHRGRVPANWWPRSRSSAAGRRLARQPGVPRAPANCARRTSRLLVPAGAGRVVRPWIGCRRRRAASRLGAAGEMTLAALGREPTKSSWTSGALRVGRWRAGSTCRCRSDPEDSHSSISAGLPTVADRPIRWMSRPASRWMRERTDSRCQPRSSPAKA